MATTTRLTEPTPVAEGPPGQPDIAYKPDFAKYQARAARRSKLPDLAKTLPEGFPTKLQGDLVWEGETLAQTYKWTYELSPDQLQEVDDAVKHFQSLDVSLGHITADTFPLPTLHPELRRLSDELHQGHGFFVIRGVRVDEHTREENVIIFSGLAAHIAPRRGRQDARFDSKPADVVITHVKDLTGPVSGEGGGERTKNIGSPAYTADKQVFHTDSGDIVALFALGAAAEGGASRLASTWRVYNHLAETRPDLIRTLSESWDVEVFAKSDQRDNKKYTTRPLLFHQPKTDSTPERVVLQYARRYFVGFGALPRSADIPAITEAQAEALDTLHFLGDRFSVATDFEKGDIQFVNNLALFHARDGFTDTQEKQRHLLRLWLRDDENAWETPEPLKPRWKQLYDGTSPETEVFPLEPYIRSESNRTR